MKKLSLRLLLTNLVLLGLKATDLQGIDYREKKYKREERIIKNDIHTHRAPLVKDMVGYYYR